MIKSSRTSEKWKSDKEKRDKTLQDGVINENDKKTRKYNHLKNNRMIRKQMRKSVKTNLKQYNLYTYSAACGGPFQQKFSPSHFQQKASRVGTKKKWTRVNNMSLGLRIDLLKKIWIAAF